MVPDGVVGTFACRLAILLVHADVDQYGPVGRISTTLPDGRLLIAHIAITEPSAVAS